MKTKTSFNLRLALLTMTLCLGATSSQATVILSDSFSGTAGAAPNTSNWTTSGGGITLSGSNSVDLNNPGVQVLTALPAYQYVPGAPDTAIFTFSINSFNTNVQVGLANSGFVNSIQIRNDLGGGTWQVYITGTSSNAYDMGIASASGVGSWEIDWTLAKVTVLHNSSTVFDSSINGPGWSIPTMAIAPFAAVYSGGSGIGLEMGPVSWSAVPEPSTVALAFVGLGIAVFAKRRRNAAATKV